jgi:hypothetical protein
VKRITKTEFFLRCATGSAVIWKKRPPSSFVERTSLERRYEAKYVSKSRNDES